MLLLFETPAGYALFKVLDEGKIKSVDNIFKHFESASAATGLYGLFTLVPPPAPTRPFLPLGHPILPILVSESPCMLIVQG